MKKNTKTYVLLAVVILIWGLLLYRMFSWGDDENTITQNNNAFAQFNPIKPTEKDTFSITVHERDPFLGTIEKPKRRTTTRPKQVETIVWPTISYKGLVGSNTGSNAIFLVDINGTQHLIKKGTTTNEITLISGNKDQVVLRFKGKRKTFKRT
ncbi:hypothetical protein [Spongiivirga citrea]|uniref:Type II secretion system protein GspC N-terminal domain-containing protein n=1 Tax=Spongiivirga citrea TaxID=1481457 RepID=A0A6M0CG05_9FLAO|nr:hypothetical protein [Spongiivirga citrea]NER16788.1 hypothetical protein [Spongiivirga citrea]